MMHLMQLLYVEWQFFEILILRAVAVENLKLSLLGVDRVGVGVKELKGGWSEGQRDCL